MDDTTAEWVRATAWTPRMRRQHDALPGPTHLCGCQLGQTGHCEAGRHDRCQGGSGDLKPEAYVTDANADVLYWPTPRRAPVELWLAPVRCRWLCPCDCHQRPATEPVRKPERARLPRRSPVRAPVCAEQPALF
ncbi:DUF6248 family natural product biosynthesis protein [Streptomonospora wellingtoniae]|uniref:DUF6248 family natural product biosynthesis protein n=1 Tax=Streptomonospora wellingtoniae TaxID=3075544 RepID=A0ABU2KUI0_9ACTN|nr:DUF6248 family natural product biosynthesis protein [Streptomonospora sp. DSM 45055]MDT0302954.1 DUF6248 family natural product biosynthesis protein [Streptomonospora sp. DSM 45055]